MRLLLLAACLSSIVSVQAIFEDTTSSTVSSFLERRKQIREEKEKIQAEIRKELEAEYQNRTAKWRTTMAAPVEKETTTPPSESSTQREKSEKELEAEENAKNIQRQKLREELREKWKDMQLGETEIDDMIDEFIKNELKNLIEVNEVTKASENNRGSTDGPADRPCIDAVGKGRDFIILFDRSGLSEKAKFINLTEGLMELINPWETKNRLALITYATDATIDVPLNSTESKAEIVEMLWQKPFDGPGDMMLGMNTTNEQVLDPLPWLEQNDKEKIVIILMADSSSTGTRETGEHCNERAMSGQGLTFNNCMQRGYAHQRALMTGKYQAKIFLITVGPHFLTNLKYVAPIEEIMHVQDFEKFSQHPLDEFKRRFCSGISK